MGERAVVVARDRSAGVQLASLTRRKERARIVRGADSLEAPLSERRAGQDLRGRETESRKTGAQTMRDHRRRRGGARRPLACARASFFRPVKESPGPKGCKLGAPP